MSKQLPKLGRPKKDKADRKIHPFVWHFSDNELKLYGGEEAMKARMDRAARKVTKS